jgi:hypothetical protein
VRESGCSPVREFGCISTRADARGSAPLPPEPGRRRLPRALPPRAPIGSARAATTHLESGRLHVALTARHRGALHPRTLWAGHPAAALRAAPGGTGRRECEEARSDRVGAQARDDPASSLDHRGAVPTPRARGVRHQPSGARAQAQPPGPGTAIAAGIARDRISDGSPDRWTSACTTSADGSRSVSWGGGARSPD